MNKYFKIVNPEGHKGMFYKEGYNEDILPFNPSGDCESGGIYFASEDILAFLDYGSDVYEVEPIGEVYENPGTPKKYKAHALNMKYIGKWSDINVIKYLVENGADVYSYSYRDGYLRNDTAKAHLQIVKYLIEQGADIYEYYNEVLKDAVWNGQLEMVQFLVENGADIHTDKDYILRFAVYSKHLEIVKYLVEKGADVHADKDYALKYAIENEHLEVAEYLKSKMDIK